MNSKSCFIMGLPAAGKTTYLAALTYYMECSKGMLHIKKYIGNHQYLTHLSEIWLTAEKVLRTNTLTEQKNLLLYLEDSDGNELQLTFPDLSGESFQKQYKDREIDEEIAICISKSDGILLFTNPEQIIEPQLILQMPIEARMSEENDSPALSRNPLQADPTEVQLVDLLQIVDYLKNSSCSSINLGIVISAWDIVDQTYITPEEFVKERLPLLWQYLTTNCPRFKVSYFGVSAQGGPLNNEDDTIRLLDFDDPIKRILVVNNQGTRGNDITLPLWEVMNK